jgi:hypothetical protein
VETGEQRLERMVQLPQEWEVGLQFTNEEGSLFSAIVLIETNTSEDLRDNRLELVGAISEDGERVPTLWTVTADDVTGRLRAVAEHVVAEGRRRRRKLIVLSFGQSSNNEMQNCYFLNLLEIDYIDNIHRLFYKGIKAAENTFYFMLFFLFYKKGKTIASI